MTYQGRIIFPAREIVKTILERRDTRVVSRGHFATHTQFHTPPRESLAHRRPLISQIRITTRTPAPRITRWSRLAAGRVYPAIPALTSRLAS